ncbi:MAG TPA: ArsR family transcriptional regulator [Candidatus Melainabacteria bacterium]|nr:ArsR family transcriptional regulator [Candidatus Melainabacteria bacterium]
MQYEFQSSGASLSLTAIRLLSRRRTIEILNAIANEARAAVEIANTLDDDLGRVWRYVHRLEKAGILTVKSQRRRGGRAQKLYEPSAQEFVVAAITREQTVSHELSRALMESLDRHDSSVAERFFFDGTRWRVEKIYSEIARGF